MNARWSPVSDGANATIAAYLFESVSTIGAARKRARHELSPWSPCLAGALVIIICGHHRPAGWMLALPAK
jgi:hypothetical protein